jgi:hypothetical protein
VLLELHRLIKHGVRIHERLLGSLVGCRCEHVLADDDHRQQHQLEKRLGDPGDEDDGAVGADGDRKAFAGDRREEVGTPHRADTVGDLDGEPRVEPGRGAAMGELLGHLTGP